MTPMTATAAKVVSITPLPLEQIIAEGSTIIDPALAARILAERVYAKQRPVESFHVTLWADMLRRGEFGQGRQIWFGSCGGLLHLVDGQHRLHAVVQTDIPAAFQVSIFPVDSEVELSELYISFDRVGRPRSVPEVLNAMGISEAHGLTKQMSAGVFRAAILLEFQFCPPHHTHDPIAVRGDNERLRYCAPYWNAAAAFEKVIKRAPAAVRKRLRAPQVLAVALATFVHQSELAGLFWGGLAENDGLRKGDPRHTLLTALIDRTFVGGANTGARLAALAWNAFYEHRSVGILKAAQGSAIRIAGTPFAGRQG